MAGYVTAAVTGLLLMSSRLDQLDIVIRPPSRSRSFADFVTSFRQVTSLAADKRKNFLRPLIAVSSLALFVGIQEAFIYCDFTEVNGTHLSSHFK
jgi:hypothetical protein